MTRIVVFLRYPEFSLMNVAALANTAAGIEVAAASTLADVLPHLAEAEVLLTIGVHIGTDAEAIYRAAPKLKWVQSFGSGTDNIKDHPALGHNVAVTNVHGVHGPQLSEAAFAAMLSHARRLPELVHDQAASRWARPVPTILSGCTVGVLGLGAIANALAPRCKAFGMTTVGISGTARPVEGFDRVVARADLTSAVAELDYPIVLTPLAPETRHIIATEVLAAMKPTACLINLARGGVLDEHALIAALDAGQIAGAVLDVFEQEPLSVDDPLWSHPKVTVWPHTAGFHVGYPAQVIAVVADNLARYRNGGVDALINRVQ